MMSAKRIKFEVDWGEVSFSYDDDRELMIDLYQNHEGGGSVRIPGEKIAALIVFLNDLSIPARGQTG